jgi:hypothetical protein
MKNSLLLLPASCLFLIWLIFLPLRRRKQVSPKRQLTFNGLQGVMLKDRILYTRKCSKLSVMKFSLCFYVIQTCKQMLMGSSLSIIIIIFFFCSGATILHWSWPLSWFRNIKFFRAGVVSPTPKPQPGGPVTALRLAPTLCPVWHGWLHQELTLPPAYLSGSLGPRKLSLQDKG